MVKTVVRSASLFLTAATFILVLLMFAQVNLSDVRLKYGLLLNPYDQTIQVGRIYEVRDDGHIKPGPPVCTNDHVTRAYFEPRRVRVHVSNVLGSNLPVISRLAGFFVPTDPTGVITTAASKLIEIDGHTIIIELAEQTSFTQTAVIEDYIEALYAVNNRCERTVARYWQQDRCLVIVDRTIHADADLIGYSYNDLCLVPNLGEDKGQYAGRPLEPPSPSRYLPEVLSTMKHTIGLTNKHVASVLEGGETITIEELRPDQPVSIIAN